MLRLGDPRLRRVAMPVTDFAAPELHDVVANMRDTMRAYDGAGLAAVQIGVSLRLVVFGFDASKRYPDAPPVPSTVLVNPEIEALSEETQDGWEGCLSVPGMRGLVPRYARIRYRGADPFGSTIEREADGFHARVVQHECDHLDGILYPDRIRDLRMFGFTEELQDSGLLASNGRFEDRCRDLGS